MPNILHISDLHFGAEPYEGVSSAMEVRFEVLGKLIETLKNMPHEWRPDIIAVTGDIGWKARKEDYDKAQKWFGKLSDEIGVPHENFIFCPGNHDIDRNKAELSNSIKNNEDSKKFLSIEKIHNRSSHFENYARFCKDFQGECNLINGAEPCDNNYVKYLYGYREICGIDFIVLNSSWCCGGDDDLGRLWIGERLVLDIKRHMPENNDRVKIAIFHHPLNNTNIAEQRVYSDEPISQDSILDISDIMLNGHVHGEIRNGTYVENKAYVLTGGATYQHDAYNLACQIIKVDVERYVYSTKIIYLLPASRKWETKNGEKDRLFRKSDLKSDNSREYHLKTYLENSHKQLKEWKIKCGKLFNILNDDADYIPMKLKDDEKEYCSDSFLTDLENDVCRHAILIGDGGMGKTTTCMRLWEICLRQNKCVIYMPLYDYDAAKTTVKKYITEICVVKGDYDRLTDEEGFVLLLDGFNEMKAEHNRSFFEELKEFAAKENIQIIITSRSDIFDIETACFSRLAFMPVDSDTIKKWLEAKGRNISASSELLGILGNPMLLKIYSANINESVNMDNIQRAEFLDEPTTKGEILWNFLEHQIVKYALLKKEEKGFYKIIFRYLLPYIAYQIEFKDSFHFTMIDLKKYIDGFERYFTDDYEKFDDLIYYEDTTKEFLGTQNRTKFLLDLCIQNFSVIRLEPVIGTEDNAYGFIHQYFRDIFSATYIKNKMKTGDKSVFTDRRLPFHILQMIGEIFQEHKAVAPMKLRGYLAHFKNEFNEKAQMGVFNVLQIIDYSRRGNLSREDFSEIDLRMYSLINNNFNKTNFSQSYISRNLFFSQGHTMEVTCVCYSPDGKHIVSASSDGTIKMWDSATGILIRTLEGHKDKVTSASFSSDGKNVVSASWDKTIKIWDSGTGTMIRTLDGHENGVASARFSPDGKNIVSASSDSTIKIWDSGAGRLIRTLGGREDDYEDDYEDYKDEVTSAGFSPDGKYIVSASSDSTIKIWDSGTGILIRTLEGHEDNYEDEVTSADFSPDGKYIVSVSNDSIKIWDSGTGTVKRTLEGHEDGVSCASFSPDGKNVVTASLDGSIKIWDGGTGTVIRTLEGHENGVMSASFSPDGKNIVSASWNGTINIWDSGTGTVIRTLEGHEDGVSSASFSLDGKYIVSALLDKTIKIWDSGTGILVRILKGHRGGVASAIFSPDGKHVVSASWDDTIRIWDSGTGKVVRILRGYGFEVESMSFSPNGKHIVFILDNTIKILPIGTLEGDRNSKNIDSALWDKAIKMGTLIQTLEEQNASVSSVNFSPDGKSIVSVSNGDTIKMWDSGTGTVIRTLDVYKGRVNNANFSPNGKHIVFVSKNTIKIWDSDTETAVRILGGHESMALSASYSPDGKRIVSASRDKTIKIWDSNSGELLQTIYPLSFIKIFGANLTGIKSDDLTAHDLLILKQNGAIIT